MSALDKLGHLGGKPLIVGGNAATEKFFDSRLKALALEAYAKQGLRAFDCTRKAAAVHEAGHAIVVTCLGGLVTRLKIAKRFVKGEPAWLGIANHDKGGWQTDADSDHCDDLNHAAILISGVIAEILFDAEDFRHGSSLDEVVGFQARCNNATNKLGCSLQETAIRLLQPIMPAVE